MVHVLKFTVMRYVLCLNVLMFVGSLSPSVRELTGHVIVVINDSLLTLTILF